MVKWQYLLNEESEQQSATWSTSVPCGDVEEKKEVTHKGCEFRLFTVVNLGSEHRNYMDKMKRCQR